MRMRTIVTALVVVLPLTLIVAASLATAAVRTIPLAAGENSLRVVGESPDQLDIRVAVGELAAMDVTTPAGEFTRLLIPGFHSSQAIGEPELPQMNRLIALPLGAEVEVVLGAVRTQRYSLADLGVSHPLLPAQPSLSKSEDPSTVPFVYDGAAYAKAVVGGELVQVVAEGTLRALRFGRLEVAPVRYFPQEGEIEVVESLEGTVRFVGADHGAQRELLARTASPFFEAVYARVSGTRGFHDAYPDRVGEVVTYVRHYGRSYMFTASPTPASDARRGDCSKREVLDRILLRNLAPDAVPAGTCRTRTIEPLPGTPSRSG